MVYGYGKYKIPDPSGEKEGDGYPIWFLGRTFGNGLDPLSSFLCVLSSIDVLWFF